jgi:hypothetical protein
VIGIYLACPEAAYPSSLDSLGSIMADLKKELKVPAGQQLLLLQVDSTTGKLTAKECEGGNLKAARPCELKTAACISNLVCVTARCGRIAGGGLSRRRPGFPGASGRALAAVAPLNQTPCRRPRRLSVAVSALVGAQAPGGCVCGRGRRRGAAQGAAVSGCRGGAA